MLWGLEVPIWKINFCSTVLRLSELPRSWEKAANCHMHSLRWPIYVFNSVVNIKLPAILSHRRSTTVSLETYTLYKIEEDSKTSTTENSTTKNKGKVITFSIQLVHSQNVWSLTNSINSFRFTNRVCGCIPGCSL